MKLQDLLEDKDFETKLNESVDIIMEDKKIDEYDVPEIVFLITTIINTEPKLKVNRKNLGSLIKEIFDHILKKNIKDNDEMSEEQKKSLDRLIDSSIKLILMKPNYSGINRFLNKILYCKK